MLLNGNHVIVPNSMRTDVLHQIHEGHLGVSKCILGAGTSVYWPGVNSEVEDIVGQCETCQLNKLKNKKNHRLVLQFQVHLGQRLVWTFIT